MNDFVYVLCLKPVYDLSYHSLCTMVGIYCIFQVWPGNKQAYIDLQCYQFPFGLCFQCFYTVGHKEWHDKTWKILVSDIAIFVLKRDVKLQLTNLKDTLLWPSFSFMNHLVINNSNKPVGFYGPIAPPVWNVPELRSLHAATPPVQSEYPAERRAAAAVPLPESP